MKVLIKTSFCVLFLFSLAFSSELDSFEEEFEEIHINDPLKPYNKAMTAFNIFVYKYALTPTLNLYKSATPVVLREGFSNIFDNLLTPLRFVSNLLIFDFKNSFDELRRFGINTFIGFGGFFDTASKMNIKKHNYDLGMVLAHYKVSSGFYIVLPFLGPSNLRDSLGLVLSWYLSPISYLNSNLASISITSFAFFNELSFKQALLDDVYYNSVDTYEFLKQAYEQNRQIK